MSSEARPELVRGLVPWESAAFKADPYPWYRRLLADGPVIRDDGILSWLVKKLKAFIKDVSNFFLFNIER